MRVWFGLLFVLQIFCLVQGQSNVHTVVIQSNFEELFMYWIDVSVGTPSKSFSVVLDTGSSDFLVPSMQCTTCAGGSISDFYNATLSTTFNPVYCTNTSYNCMPCNPNSNECVYQMPYVGITETAFAAVDTILLSPMEVTTTFGAILDIDMGSFYNHQPKVKQNYRLRNRELDPYPEGMFGLAYPSINALGAQPLLDAYISDGLMNNMFSMCLRNDGGVLTLGGSRLPEESYSYTPIVKEDYYRFNMLDVKIDGVSIGISSAFYNQGNCIVDTGTPVPTFPIEAYHAIRNTFEANCTDSNLVGVCTGVDKGTIFDQQCFNLTSAQIDAYPTIFIEIENVVLSYKPQDYLMKMYYCRKGYVGLGVGWEANWTIIGAKLLQSYDVVYDRESTRIGFALSTSCDP